MKQQYQSLGNHIVNGRQARKPIKPFKSIKKLKNSRRADESEKN
jgi:hypothetical protein